jgi:Na+/melibiose symporter-like transporter
MATPVWATLVKRLGLVRCWGLGMGLSVLTFAGATWLGQGDASLFLLVCLLSGMALGADLSLPGALLTSVIQQGRDENKEGAYFGWWNFANKLNLALAAGICLPVLSALGYRPGEHHEGALQALSWAYGLIPCVFKLAALCMLYKGLDSPLPDRAHQQDRGN